MTRIAFSGVFCANPCSTSASRCTLRHNQSKLTHLYPTAGLHRLKDKVSRLGYYCKWLGMTVIIDC